MSESLDMLKESPPFLAELEPDETESAAPVDNSLSPTRRMLGYVVGGAAILAVLYFAVFKQFGPDAKMDTATAFMLMLVTLVVGELVSIRTKASVPAIFITAVLFVVGFWTFFPTNILNLGGIAPNLPGFCVIIMVANLGTMLDKDELLTQWKTIIITAAGMAGVALTVLTIGWVILGRDTAVVATPPLTGGVVSAIMMQEAVTGNDHLFILAMAMYVLQGFAGFPLTNICLKIEGRNLLKRFRAGDMTGIHQTNPASENVLKYRIFPESSKAYQTDYIIMLKAVVLVVLSGYLETLSGGTVSRYVFALLMGVVGAELGFIERKPLEKSRSLGMFMMIIMMYVFASLNAITYDILMTLLIEFLVLIVLAVIGIALLSIPIGVKLGYSKAMSFAIGLGSLAGGFPASYVLSDEAAKVLSENDEEYRVLIDHFLPKTLVAGFVSATTGSVLIAGLIITLFF